MDTEEHIEIQKAKNEGHSHSDEGPYYHHSWWESYKGGVKGKIGGLFIGALIGLIAGGTAALAISFLPGTELGALSLAAIIGGFTAGGMIYGAHDFDTIGKVSGAVAASQETAEQRMKSFENGKFQEMKREINELKAMISGQPMPTASLQPETSTAAQEHYRTTHYNKSGNGPTKFIFWDIATIGLMIGMAAGALLQFGGLTETVMHELGSAALGGGLSTASQYAFSMIAMGAIGASFGVNRDIFRQAFDKTDLLFKGLFKEAFSGKGHTPEQFLAVDNQHSEKQEKNSKFATVVYERQIEYPASDTYHRDKALASAKKALLSMDHTNSIPH